MSNLELLPLPSLIDGRTFGEIDGSLQEGNEDVVIYDGNVAYPSISIDPKQIIKSSVVKGRLSSAFITPPQPTWKKVLNLILAKRILSVLFLLANLQPPSLADCRTYLQKFKSMLEIAIKNISLSILWIYNRIINLYAKFFPYAMLSSEETGQIFSPSLDWQNGVIKCFRWRSTGLRAALALSNDDVFIYSTGNTIVLLLRHPFQKKIINIVWNPKSDDEIAIICQQVIVLWSLKCESPNEKSRVPLSQATVIDNEVRSLYPITSATYDPTGNQIFVSSPSSSKILILDHPLKKPPPQAPPAGRTEPPVVSPQPKLKPTISSPSVMQSASTSRSANVVSSKVEPEKEKVTYLRKWGQGVHKVLFAPNGTRLLTLPTSSCIRIYEKFAWSSKTWGGKMMSDICQCAVWSKPLGHYLLIAPRKEPSIYAVVMYDQPLAGEVGGEPTFMKVLDLSEYELPNGQTVGGAIHDMAWDAHSARLVIAFEDNSEFLAVFKTTVRSILEIEPLGFIHGHPGEKPLAMDFHDSFKRGSLLTVCWSSGFVSHLPFAYDLPSTQSKNRTLDINRSTRNNTSCSSTPRNLTSYCKSPLLSSPLMPSPIGTPRNQHSDSFTDGPISATSTSYQSKHFLSSDSVISPRKPTLFSQLSVSSGVSSQ